MKEIVFIQPKAGSFEMLEVRFLIGLLSIAAISYLEVCSIKIIDQRIDNNWQETLKRSFRRNPICVGI